MLPVGLAEKEFKMIYKSRISRREFFKKAGVAAGAATIGSIPLINACKGGSTTPSQKVSVNVQFYNHTQGPQVEKTYEGISGDSFKIRISDLGMTAVTATRIAVRQAGSREVLGSLIEVSRTAEVSLRYPKNNENWEAYLMNSGNGAPYEIFDYLISPPCERRIVPCVLQWHREDRNNATGPEEPILEAVRQLGEALNYPWKRYGSFIKDDTQGVLNIGYCENPYCWGLDYVYIVPADWSTPEDKLKGFINCIFKFVTLAILLNDHRQPYHVICDQNTGGLNAIGRDLLAYGYVSACH
jgi:hypothetical protein